MSKQVPVADTEALTDTQPTLPRKRRLALVSYLALLFVVALAIVTLSLISQIQSNKDQYNTIAAKAQALQADNAQLQAEYDTLLRDYTQEIKQSAALQSQLQRVQEDSTQLQGDLDALSAEKQETLTAYDLLTQAMSAAIKQDKPAFTQAMTQLADVQDKLPEQAQPYYKELLALLASSFYAD